MSAAAVPMTPYCVQLDGNMTVLEAESVEEALRIAQQLPSPSGNQPKLHHVRVATADDLEWFRGQSAVSS